MSTSYNIWKQIVYALRKNSRPTVHGKILKLLDLERYSKKDTFSNIRHFVNYSFGSITKDYLPKKDGTIRDNAYLVSIDVFLLVSYYCYKIFKFYGNRNDVYYSGNLDTFDMFYDNSYSKFQKELLSTYSSYDFYMKIDIKNFYKNIDLNNLTTRFPKTKKLISFLQYLGINEFPIFQDCAGLSYIATVLYLANVDSELADYISLNAKRYKLLRYSDDLYILFGKNNSFGNISKKKVQKK